MKRSLVARSISPLCHMPGHKEHVGLRDALVEVGARTHLKAVDSGLAHAEAVLQTIGGMREAYSQILPGRKHVEAGSKLDNDWYGACKGMFSVKLFNRL